VIVVLPWERGLQPAVWVRRPLPRQVETCAPRGGASGRCVPTISQAPSSDPVGSDPMLRPAPGRATTVAIQNPATRSVTGRRGVMRQGASTPPRAVRGPGHADTGGPTPGCGGWTFGGPGGLLPAWGSGWIFSSVQSNNYWSSTSYAANTGNAWNVNFNDGNVNNNDKPNTNYVWPVRAGA
jgi:hypothetical protein